MLTTVELGRTGRTISRIGLGGMWLSIEGRPDREQAKRVIRRAVELGVTFIDTADVYCLDQNDLHHNERLIAEALEEIGASGRVLVATKGGLTRPEGRWENDARPESLREAALRSRDALGVERIALYQLHGPDREVPFGASVEALAALRADGVIEAVGLSNVDLDQLRAAEEIVEVTSVQNRYNPWDRSSEESGLLRYCDENRVTFIPYSPLGGARRVKLLQADELVRRMAAERDATPAEEHATPAERDATPAELVLAWSLSKSKTLVPIPSARREGSIESSVRAVGIELGPEMVSAAEKAFDSLPP